MFIAKLKCWKHAAVVRTLQVFSQKASIPGRLTSRASPIALLFLPGCSKLPAALPAHPGWTPGTFLSQLTLRLPEDLRQSLPTSRTGSATSNCVTYRWWFGSRWSTQMIIFPGCSRVTIPSLSSDWNLLHNLAVNLKLSCTFAHSFVWCLCCFLSLKPPWEDRKGFIFFWNPLRVSSSFTEQAYAGCEYVTVGGQFSLLPTLFSDPLGWGIESHQGIGTELLNQREPWLTTM